MKVILIDEKPKREYKHRMLTDVEMISDGLRLPMYKEPVFYSPRGAMRDKERSDLYTHKRAYSELKRTKPDVYRHAQQELIRAFLKSDTPVWGGFRFQGVKV